MTFEARQRGPLVDSHSRTIIEQRSKEVLGVIMLAACVAFAILLGTYSASDPGLFTANDNPVQNFLGETGAAIASPLMLIIGLSSWGFVIFLAIWAFRFMSHIGDDRFLNRLLYLPFLIVSVSVHLTILTPPESWPHGFGIGGMFGETALSAIVYSWPAGVEHGEAVSSYVSGGAVFLFSFLALGVTLEELAGLAGLFSRSRRERRRKVASIKSRQAANKSRPGSVIGPLATRRDVRTDTKVTNGLTTDGQTAVASSGKDAGNAGQPRDKPREKSPMMWRLLTSMQRGRNTEIETIDSSGRSRIVRGVSEPPITRRIADHQSEDLLDDEPAESTELQHENQPVVSGRKSKRRTVRQKTTVSNAGEDTYELPSIDLLQPPAKARLEQVGYDSLKESATRLREVLEDYGVNGTIEAVHPGPVVTLYELLPEPGLKASRVMGLSDDIARNMSAISARISTVPGKQIIGIELPNNHRETVYLREMLSDPSFTDSSLDLPIALGKDIGGQPMIVDLATMPHLLIAGTTGSGKSVAINTMILSLLYRQSPDECRMIMIDPKMLELSVYDGIPNLLSPVVTDPKQAVFVLKWVVAEMESRYRKMSKMGVRKLSTYNDRMREAQANGQKFTRTVQSGFDQTTGEPIIVEEVKEPETLPYIVVVVDEMADLMMAAGKEIEACIQRLAQMARASGIHVVLATQRPSVDVITGTIKANIPTRASFQVASKIDSRTVLGEQGAEQLLGCGDMLLMSGGSKITRVHGPFVDDSEVEMVVSHLKEQGAPDYLTEIVEGPDEAKENSINQILGLGGNTSSDDEQYDIAVQIIRNDRKCSTSYIQRKLGIGYNKAARLVERMEEEGLVSAPNHVGKREILIPE